MKKYLLLLSLLTQFAYTQINYEKGYFINNSGIKQECLLKFKDTEDNPSFVIYKIDENSKPQKITISQIQEFSIPEKVKFIRATVSIDQSKSDVGRLSNTKNPVFIDQEVLLKVLVEGKSTLYSYKKESIKRFFFKTETSAIQPLVYKEYSLDNRTIKKNNTYQQQLFTTLTSENISLNKIKKTRYTTSDLVKLFIQYNGTENKESVNYENKEKRDFFNLRIRPGIRFASIDFDAGFSLFQVLPGGGILFGISRQLPERPYSFDKTTFLIGVEAEFVLPFNKEKWAIVLDPKYQSFKDEQTFSDGNTIAFDYKSLEVPIGVRHYFLLNKKAKIFVSGQYVLDFAMDSNVSVRFARRTEPESVELVTDGGNFELGIGFDYNSRYHFEVEYGSPREILQGLGRLSAKYDYFSFGLGYTLF